MFISGYSNSGSEQHSLLSLGSKGQKSGWAELGWTACPSWGSGKHCSQYHFQGRIQSSDAGSVSFIPE